MSNEQQKQVEQFSEQSVEVQVADLTDAQLAEVGGGAVVVASFD